MERDVGALGEAWDVVVVGGGATGLGCAVDAASRGYRTLLVEQGDFAQGTSSRSTKLVHGGVRYLRQGDVALVIDALKERGTLLRNAPHLVRELPFLVPSYDWWEGPFYGVGLKLYDLLAGRHGFGASKLLSREKTLERIPTLEPKGLLGGVVYHDGQFDDARLAVNLAQTAAERGAAVLNYVRVDSLVKEGGEVRGVVARDVETGEEREVRGRVVLNATGVWADELRRVDDPSSQAMLTPSQGVHIVLERGFLPGDTAIMVPRTEDKRVLFAIPWRGRVLVGTTETPVDEAPLEPRPFAEELEYLLRHAARYLTRDPRPEDVLSTFAGLRPLVGAAGQAGTASLSRDHTITISASGLVTVVGGKWTTYRKMAEDAIDHAAVVAGLDERPSPTKELPIHGWHPDPDSLGELQAYGGDASELSALLESDAALAAPLHPAHEIRAGEVVWAARREMARTVEDVLSRRTRLLIIDARAALEAAPAVAALLARELGRDDAWAADQVRSFTQLAEGYLPPGLG